MSAKKSSGKSHTKEQLDNWANQNNPNNKAYNANLNNHANLSLIHICIECDIAFKALL